LSAIAISETDVLVAGSFVQELVYSEAGKATYEAVRHMRR